MPKDTFFRLSEVKQDRILEAAKKEFTEYPLPETSIARIVKLAEIPRGSFYQYFEDKEDLYFYYFETLRKKHSQDILDVFRQHQGDLFIAFESYFTLMIREILVGPDAKFYKNVFLHMNYKETRRISPELMGPRKFPKFHSGKNGNKGKALEKLIGLVNRENLKIKSDEELQLLLRTLNSIALSSIGDGYRRQTKEADEFQIEKTIAEFHMKLDWLKNGVYIEKRSN